MKNKEWSFQSKLASSFICDKFEDYICKNGTLNTNKANLRDSIAATGLVILLKIRIKSSIFFAHVTLKFDGWPRKQ